MSQIGKIIPQKIKEPLVKRINNASNIVWKAYIACGQGKLYCPDSLFQRWDYYVHTGRKLNLKNPVTFQDKLQWLKLHNRDPLYTTLVDKYAVREWVKEKIGEEYLVPLYGVYDSFDEINFDKLPNQFVLKCTHDSGSVVICKDKTQFDFQKAREVLEKGLAREQFYLSREWPYKGVPHRIICEGYLGENINDYKFFCFDGKLSHLMVATDRQSKNGVKITFFSPEWERLPFSELKTPTYDKEIEKPKTLEEMICLSENLSKGIPHVRVDFYYVNEKIYFGEMTFFDGGGRCIYEPEEYNRILGDLIELPMKKRKHGTSN